MRPRVQLFARCVSTKRGRARGFAQIRLHHPAEMLGTGAEFGKPASPSPTLSLYHKFPFGGTCRNALSSPWHSGLGQGVVLDAIGISISKLWTWRTGLVTTRAAGLAAWGCEMAPHAPTCPVSGMAVPTADNSKDQAGFCRRWLTVLLKSGHFPTLRFDLPTRVPGCCKYVVRYSTPQALPVISLSGLVC